MPAMKVGTCCYCGRQTVLELRGNQQHELACASCGAPLSRMKMLPKDPGRATARAATPARPAPSASALVDRPQKGKKGKKIKGSKVIGRRLLSGLWDAIEEVFD